jgi:hypothetical protein
MRRALFENRSQQRFTEGMPVPPLTGILGSPAREPSRGHRASEIADLVRAQLNLPEDAPLTVSQIACREPGCPPVETVIAMLSTPARRWTIPRPLSHIDDRSVIDLLTHSPHGDSHD